MRTGCISPTASCLTACSSEWASRQAGSSQRQFKSTAAMLAAPGACRGEYKQRAGVAVEEQTENQRSSQPQSTNAFISDAGKALCRLPN
jgi:hypothetical protein